MEGRRRGGPDGAVDGTTPEAWDRASALCGLARLLLEPSLTPPDERAWAEVRGWPGVEAVPVSPREPGSRACGGGGERVGVRVSGGPPDLQEALDAAVGLVAAARRRWESDLRRDEQVRSLVGAERAAWAEAEGARAENALWSGFADELRSTIGHDLRNPLSVLSGHAQLLEAGLVGPAATRTTGETLLRQVDRLGTMFDRLVAALAIAAAPPGRVHGGGREELGAGVAAALAELPASALERVQVAGAREQDTGRSGGAGAGGIPIAGRAALGAVVKAALLAGNEPVRVTAVPDPTGDRVVVTSEGLRRGRPDPRTGWTRGGADPSGALAAVARYVRALGGELDAAPGRVTLTWPPPGPEVVGLVADATRAAELAARVLPPLRVVVRVGALGPLPGDGTLVLVDAEPAAHAAWRDATSGLLRPPAAVVLGATQDGGAFGVLPADATAEEVTAELCRAIAAAPPAGTPPERVDVLLELGDVDALVAAVGPTGPERALRWVEGVAQWVGGSAVRVARVDGTRVAVAGVRGDPAAVADRIVECCAGIRPRIGPFRVSVAVRALATEAGALRDGSWRGGPAAPGTPGPRD